MSLEHQDDRRKAMSQRAKAMARAAKVVGPSVRNMALYGKDPNKRAELASLLALNVNQPGAFGRFIGEVRVENERGFKRAVVRQGAVKDTLLRWSVEASNLIVGWPLDELAAVMGLDRRDSRVRRRAKAMTAACAKLGIAAEPYQGRFKILTIPEAAVKQEQQRASIEGQIKARARKSKPLRVKGYEPTGKQNIQLAWWDLPQFRALEGGTR